MNLALYYLLAVAAGSMLPIQAAMNSKLARAVGSPVWAAAISGVVVTLVLCGLALAIGRTMPRTESFSTLPWWAWCGGFCGAVVLCATTSVTPKLGSASMIALVIAGQVLTSVAMDHFAVMGLAEHTLDIKRIIAALMLIIAAILI